MASLAITTYPDTLNFAHGRAQYRQLQTDALRAMRQTKATWMLREASLQGRKGRDSNERRMELLERAGEEAVSRGIMWQRTSSETQFLKEALDQRKRSASHNELLRKSRMTDLKPDKADWRQQRQQLDRLSARRLGGRCSTKSQQSCTPSTSPPRSEASPEKLRINYRMEMPSLRSSVSRWTLL
mmetsp:Transcript_16759/g.37088  ORF Transcript_16759/g.37088 Transcript_16759/m.37088 type:complete len:184 (+) Transcript_16759:52-603(+)|eukprot:CAMPEP_0204340766 /NCGR_PEP_ID=MMETSP0469-20131031/22833_1 /ASSEMBLY_ACC=CAM_ASM_000384 /TAXON_ID=2969 /ORGANISM="Oxyrrhis marina" /LENGTH=183 /DNA_ID=CAMNT_0051325359 /DNA_START=47 /DNA_END=598 /DNA_ORIENTATION=-